jgi:hypothetical protein
MKTALDDCFEILLENLFYDGVDLTVKLTEQIANQNRNIKTSSDSRNFIVVFSTVMSHLVVEEFAEAVANLVKSSEEGFLKKMDNQLLTNFLGLNILEGYENLNCYALLTSHEILIVFSEHIPTVELIQQ